MKVIMGALMPTAQRKQAEWFRLFLDSCVSTRFDAEAEAEMRRLGVSRPEVMSVIFGGEILRVGYPEAGVVSIVAEDKTYDETRLRVSARTENDRLRVSVVWVEKPDGA
jgi:hypothetical protein